MPTPQVPNVPLDQVQGIILRGYELLQAARFLLLGLGERAGARRWLQQLLPHIHSAKHRPTERAVNGRENQPEALLRRQAGVVLGNRLRARIHRPSSFLPISTAWRASSRLSSTSTPIARRRASASAAVRRDFSPVGNSAPSTCRSRP